MAGWIGPILAVRLLGRASIYLMTPASQAFQLAWTNRTMSLAPGQMGSLCVARIRIAECQARPSVQSVAPRRFPRAEAGGHRGQCRCPRHRFAYVFRRSWLGWSFTPMSRGVRITSMCWSTGHWSGLSGTVCRLNSSAAGPGPDAATAMQHSTAEAPTSSVAITPSIASLARSARPRGSESSSCATSPEYPSHPNCWYSPVGWVYSPHSNVI